MVCQSSVLILVYLLALSIKVFGLAVPELWTSRFEFYVNYALYWTNQQYILPETSVFDSYYQISSLGYVSVFDRYICFVFSSRKLCEEDVLS